MAKILKYCNSCEEGFAERFTFCPDCGASLQAVELNPVVKATEDNVVDVPSAPPVFIADEVAAADIVETAAPTPEPEIVHEEVIEEPVSEPEIFAGEADDTEDEVITVVPPVVPVAPAPVYQTAAMHADVPRTETYSTPNVTKEDDGFYVTVIQEKNVKQRNALLLGSTAFVLFTMLGAWAFSLFSKDIGIASIGDETSLAWLIEDVPMPVEEEELKPEAKDKDSGGGGGGGREDKEPTSQGDLANQTKNPIRPPDARVHRSDNFELKTPPPSTQGNKQFEQKYGRWGDPNSTFAGVSNGPGTGGGQGTGTGTGQGSGRGTGAGSGSGSGFGSGVGNGNGDGTGDGAPPARAVPTGVTSNFKIISKPQARYTDAARTNAVQGVVKVKVTLLASGQVGSVTPVTRLPHGLTEQAIAAAKLIKFEPKKVNGVPTPTIVTVEYSFTMY